MNFSVIHEDTDVVIIDKPPGVVVNRAESVKAPTVPDWAAERFGHTPDLTGAHPDDADFYERAGIVHRIDKETSGLLMLAKTPAAFRELQRQFKEREIAKTYLALAHGKVVPDQGEINAPVGRLPWNRERFGVVPDGKEAVTTYTVLRVIERSEGKDREIFALLELRPKTGRTHQIRVHLKYINHPIVGDFLYAGRITSRNDRVWAPRVLLHAWKLTFTSPTRGERISVTAPLPDDLAQLIGEGNNGTGALPPAGA